MMSRTALASGLFLATALLSPSLIAADDKTMPVPPPAAESAAAATPVPAESAPAPAATEAAPAPLEAPQEPAPASSDEAKQGERAPQEKPKSNGKGFYFRVTVGPGHTWAHADRTADQSEISMQSWSGNVMVSPGYQFVPGFAIHGDVYFGSAFAHDVSSEGNPSDYSADGAGLFLSTVGVGLTYHALPADLYVSAGFGASAAMGTVWEVNDAGNDAVATSSEVTEPGYAAHGSVGKLFSIHRRWGMGAALNYNYQTFGRSEPALLSFQKAHTLWIGFVANFHP